MEASRSVQVAGSSDPPTRVFLLAANHAEAREFARHYADAVIVDDAQKLMDYHGGTIILCGHYYDRLGASAALELAIGRGMRVMFQREPGDAPRFEREPDFSIFDLKDAVACGECGTLRARSVSECSTCRAVAQVRP